MPTYNWNSLSTDLTDPTGLSSYGPDVSTWAAEGQTSPDLDPAFTEITSRRCIAEALARRLCTPRGSLDGSPNDGEDLRTRLNRPLTSRELFDIQVAIQREAAKDERVQQAYVSLTYDAQNKRLVPDVTIVPMVGEPFKFTLAIDQVSFAIGAIQ